MPSYTWKPEHEARLDALVAPLLATGTEQFHATLPTPLANAHQKLITTSSDILALHLVYIDGFDDIWHDGPLASKTTPEVAKWVKTVGVRSPWVLAGLVATTECAILERFIKEFATLHVTSKTVLRVRTSFATRNLAKKDTKKAAAQLVKFLKPSAGSANTNWVTDLDTVLGCKLDPAVAGSLVSMIVFRNGFIHDPMDDDLLNGRWDKPVTGEQIRCWALSVILCARAILDTKYPQHSTEHCNQ